MAKLAFEKAKSAPTPERRAELTEIARICAKVPRKAPDTFYEALQFVLFIHLMIQMESNGHSISMGRMDSYLKKYYDRDREAGRIDAAFAPAALRVLPA